MTEFPQLSVHCHLPECKQVDFLPFTCDGCGGAYCLEHRTYESHACSNPQTEYRAIFCPICEDSITSMPGEDPNVALNRHIEEGCKPNKAKALMEESKKENTCTLRRCKKFELSPVICKACKQTFCMEHRLEMDHNCPGKPVAAQRKTAKKKKQPKASSTQAQLDEYRREKARQHASRPQADTERTPLPTQQQQQDQQQKREDAGCTGGESCVLL